MTKFTKAMIATAAIAAFPAMVSAQSHECHGLVFNTIAVAQAGAKVLNPVVDFSGSGGQLDPTPLLQTEINVPAGYPACLVVHFSVQADPFDNFVVFQASLDNVPMTGHAHFITGLPTPVVFDPEETNLNNSRMLSYTFFAPVTPGKHLIRIRLASCCTSNPTGGLVIRASTLVAQY